MKIAVVSDTGTNVSRHFGRAKYFVVYEVQERDIKGKELREKPVRHNDHHHHNNHNFQSEHEHEHHQGGGHHREAVEIIKDCQVLIAGGMGYGAQRALTETGIKIFFTDQDSADAAVEEYLSKF